MVDLTMMQAMSPEQQIGHLAKQLHETQVSLNRVIKENREIQDRITALEMAMRAAVHSQQAVKRI